MHILKKRWKGWTTRADQLYSLFYNLLYHLWHRNSRASLNAFRGTIPHSQSTIDNPCVLIILNPRRISTAACPTSQRLVSLHQSRDIPTIAILDPLYRLNQLAEEVGTSKPLLALKYLIKHLSPNKSLHEFWLDIFKTYKPSKVVSLMPCQAIIDAAKETAIKLYDLQHGMIHSEHSWYLRIASNLEAQSKNQTLPNLCFLVWSQQEKEFLLEIMPTYGNLDNTVTVVGPPPLILENPSDKSLTSQQERSQEKQLKILFTSSYDLGLHYNKEELKLIDQWHLATNEFISFTQKNANMIVRFRLHPAARTFRCSKRQRRGIHFLQRRSFNNDASATFQESTGSLAKDLDWCDLHLTLNSSVCLEASTLGITSLVLCPAQHRHKYEAFRGHLKDLILFRQNYDDFETALFSAMQRHESLQSRRVIRSFRPRSPSSDKIIELFRSVL